MKLKKEAAIPRPKREHLSGGGRGLIDVVNAQSSGRGLVIGKVNLILTKRVLNDRVILIMCCGCGLPMHVSDGMHALFGWSGR